MALEKIQKGIPTMYAGVRFRSRLEATWAAFFDNMKWKWQYEPFDLDGWIPDFQLVIPEEGTYLIEVKPIPVNELEKEQHYSVRKKLVAACEGHSVVLVGTSPGEEFYCPSGDSRPSDYWAYVFSLGLNYSTEYVEDSRERDEKFFGKSFSEELFLENFDTKFWNTWPFIRGKSTKFWAAAKNEVQWRAPR